MKNKDHARFWGANKLPYGRCASAHRNYRVKNLNEKTSSCSYRCSCLKESLKKIQAFIEFESWTLRYRCSTLQFFELTSQLGASR